jgi:hypothetical protein
MYLHVIRKFGSQHRLECGELLLNGGDADCDVGLQVRSGSIQLPNLFENNMFASCNKLGMRYAENEEGEQWKVFTSF